MPAERTAPLKEAAFLTAAFLALIFALGAAAKAPQYEVFVLAGLAYGKLGEWAKAVALKEKK
jgi:hypothetical protein